MEDYKLEIGKVYRSENVVLVSRDFLEKTVTEKTLMVRDINYLLMNKANSLSHTKWAWDIIGIQRKKLDK